MSATDIDRVRRLLGLREAWHAAMEHAARGSEHRALCIGQYENADTNWKTAYNNLSEADRDAVTQ